METFDSWPDGGCEVASASCNNSFIEHGGVGAYPECAGGKCFRCDYHRDESECHFYPNANAPPSPTQVFTRFYVKFGENFRDGFPYRQKLARLFTDDGTEFNVSMAEGTEIKMPVFGPDIDESWSCRARDIDFSRFIDQWIKVEFFFKLNTPGNADGECKVWVTTPDGAVTFVEETHQFSRSETTFNEYTWIIANVSHGAVGDWPPGGGLETRTIFLDDICIGDSLDDRDTTCGSTGP